MPELNVVVTMKTQRKYGPDGNFNDLANRLAFKAPIIAYRTAQHLGAYARLTAPQPPRQAWWYAGVNPKTRKAVPWYDRYVRTGDLRSSITPPIKIGPGEYDVLVLADYARFVEHGTRFMPAQPFWRESVKHVRHNVMRPMVKDWLRRTSISSSGTGPDLLVGRFLG